jgi:hypothetical protein
MELTNVCWTFESIISDKQAENMEFRAFSFSDEFNKRLKDRGGDAKHSLTVFVLRVIDVEETRTDVARVTYSE